MLEVACDADRSSQVARGSGCRGVYFARAIGASQSAAGCRAGRRGYSRSRAVAHVLRAASIRRTSATSRAASAKPAWRSLHRVAAALGADVSLRIYPNTRTADPRSPSRHGWSKRSCTSLPADLGSPRRGRRSSGPFGASSMSCSPDRRDGRIVSVEAQSELRRLEQQIRWAAEKTDALPSAAIWPARRRRPPWRCRGSCSCGRRRTRELARSFASTLAAAYPADPRASRSARRSDPPWPGNGIVWVRVEGARRRSSRAYREGSTPESNADRSQESSARAGCRAHSRPDSESAGRRDRLAAPPRNC